MKYKVVFQGKLHSGWSEQEARDALAKRFKMGEKALSRIFSSTTTDSPVTFKKALTNDQARKYLLVLNQCGIKAVRVEDPDASSTPTLSIQTLSLKENVDQSKSISSPEQTTCPKCDYQQPPSEQCQNCGLFFAKYHQSQLSEEAPPQPVQSQSNKDDSPPDTTSSVPVRNVFAGIAGLILFLVFYQIWSTPTAADGIVGLPYQPIKTWVFPDAPYSMEDMLVPGYINVISIVDPTCSSCQRAERDDARLMSVRSDIAIRRVEINRFNSHFDKVDLLYGVEMSNLPFRVIFDREGKIIAKDKNKDQDARNYYNEVLHRDIPR